MGVLARNLLRIFCVVGATLIFLAPWGGKAFTQGGTYVGSETCSDCHPDEYDNYLAFSKKAHSGNSVKAMADDLTQEELEECFHCHTTGYGKSGGFISFEETPDMVNAGCEVCHGPGADHVDLDGDPDYIKGDLDIEDCESCHNADRVASFDYKPLIYGGAH